MMRPAVTVLTCILALAGCGLPAPVTSDLGEADGGDADSTDALTEEEQQIRLAETISGTDADSWPDLAVSEATEELPSRLECDPGEGCFLDQCSENKDCQSGWCVQHLGEGVCSQTCQEECPPGWSCRQVAGTDPDLVYVCVSQYANLCRPCASHENCTSTGGAEDACVLYGTGGSFCGGACGDDESCPWGFSCQEVTTVEGTTLMQCIHDTGECPCTGTSVELGLTTPCSVANEFGTCEGKRVCADDGLSDCDATTPAPEICNGLDDDCDGETDEPELVDGDYVNLCQDGNDCTSDKCMGEEGCVNEVLSSGDCSDGNPCTVADHCLEGECLGDPVLCDDENPCTDNVCTETGGCEYPHNTLKCDDADPCTLADQCAGGECLGTEVPCDCQLDEDCAALEDLDLCNGTLVCNLDALPFKCVVDPSTIVICPEPEGENAFCLQAACAPETGECSFVPHHEGFLCDNGDACTAGEKCVEGVCTGGAPVNCNDGNPCTDDGCDSLSGCVHTNNNSPCNDENVCTTQDLCLEGLCTGGPALECDDGNVCTDEQCDSAVGCVQTANEDPCEDGSACTENDLCVQGKCMPGLPLVCNDGNVCTTDSCDSQAGCVFTLNDVPCDDDNLCTTGDHCQLGGCIGKSELVCNDGNNCTDDACNPLSGCEFVPNNDACDDVNQCTLGDTCVDGQCKVFAMLDCDDDNQCTTDSCEPAAGCLHLALDEVPCDDQDLCTTIDQCQLGTCTGTTPAECGESDDCATRGCDPELGCVELLLDVECDDDNPLSANDWCVDGLCLGLLDQDGDGVNDADDLCPGNDDTVDIDNDGQPDGCEVQWAGAVEPPDGTVVLEADGLVVRLRIHKPGVTDVPGQGENILVKIRYKLNGTPDWTVADMEYAFDDVNLDVYGIVMPADILVADGTLLVDFTIVDTSAGEESPFQYNNQAIADATGKSVPMHYPVLSGGCGNGILDIGEECDDGNEDSGDGCSKLCAVECQTCLYVAKWGNDEWAGLADAPLLTIQKAVDLAVSGTTIIVFEGIYKEKVTLKADITIRGVDRSRVVVHGGSDRAFEGGSATGFGTTIERLTIRNNPWTYNACTYFGHNISPTLRNVRLGPCGGDCLVGWRSSPRLFGSLVKDCERGATFIYQHGSGTCGGGAGIPAELRNNTFVDCQTGIAASAAHCSPIVENNIFADCKWGLYEDNDKSCGWFEFDNSYNLFSGNEEDYKQAASPGTGELHVEPLFVGGDDYHLRPGSPAIDAGKPGTFDADGSPADLGHAGGPDAITTPSLFAGYDFAAPLGDHVVVPGLSEHANGVIPFYAWSQAEFNPVQVELVPNYSPAALSTDYEALLPGNYTFGLKVTYGNQNSQADTVVVTVAPPKTVHVPADFASIQEAVDAAVKGDVVLVAEGYYLEKVVMKPGVTLRGEGPDKTIIDGQWCEPAAILGADNTVIENLQVRGSPDMGYMVDLEGYEATLRNCLLLYTSSGGTALRLGGDATQTIEFNTFGPAQWGTHMFIYNGDQAVIRHNIVTGGYAGIHCYSAAATLEYNDVWDNADNDGNPRNYVDCQPAPTDISADPLFVAPDDYHLQEGSPCIDAGDPATPEPDGTPPDMGAFPFGA